MWYNLLIDFSDLEVINMNQKTLREKTIRDAKSNLILDAARNVFSDKGFHESRLEDIAACAGFSKASLYNYFQDKEEIFLSLAIRDFEELLEKIRTGILDTTIPILSALEHTLRTVFSFFGEQFSFFWETANFQAGSCLQFHQLHGHHEEMRRIFQSQYSELLSSVSGVLTAARTRGEIQTPLDDKTLLGIITALARGTIFEWKIQGKMGDVEKAVHDLVTFTASGLGIKKT
jgi:AcrR family transcriptional regulator